MSCSSLTTGRLRRGGPDRHAIAGRRRAPHHRRAGGDRRSAPRRWRRARGRDEHRRPRRRLAGGGSAARPCRPTTADPAASPAPRRSTARSSSSATRQAPSSAPTSKPGSTNSARRRWSFAGRSRPMRSKRRRGTPPISAIRCLSSPTRAGRPTRSISEAGSGRRRSVRALALAHLEGETATIVDAATALRAAATAKARQRRRAAKSLTGGFEFNRRRRCSILRAMQIFKGLSFFFCNWKTETSASIIIHLCYVL